VGRLERNLSGLALIGLAAVVLAPLVLYPDPALLDFQSHLARLWVIADPQHQQAVARFYSVDWSHVSNDIFVDLVARLLGGALSAQAIGRLCLALSIILPPLGAAALNIRLFGRPGAQALILPFFAWTLTALGGFMNFQIGAGLALLAIAIEPAFGKARLARMLGRIACGVAIYLAHGLDLIFYAILLAVMSLEPGAPRSGQALRALGAASAALVSAAVVVAATGVLPGNAEHAHPSPGYHWHGPFSAIASIVSPLRAYDARIDALLAVAAAGALGLAAARGRTTFHRGLITTAAIFALLSPFMPYITPSGGWTDRRLPLLAFFTALAALRIDFPRRADAIAFAAAAALLVAARTGYIAHEWAGAQRLSDAVDQALAPVPGGSAVIALQHEPGAREIAARPPGRFLGKESPAYWFSGSAVVWLKGGFAPTLFAQRGVHPFSVTPAWRDMAYVEGGDLPSVAVLTDPRLMARFPPYLSLWRRFDYVLVLNADFADRNGPVRLPPELTEVKDAGFAQLWRIAAPAPATVAAPAQHH
jgi:hypothetical protein